MHRAEFFPLARTAGIPVQDLAESDIELLSAFADQLTEHLRLKFSNDETDACVEALTRLWDHASPGVEARAMSACIDALQARLRVRKAQS